MVLGNFYEILSKRMQKLSRRNLFPTDYFINSYKLENVDSLIGLGISFDQKLRFNLRIELLTNKTRCVHV